ncbi:MAG: hypothetical protein EPN22_11720 [Nitrospirae bacterium]|nr:MAG: hypothetical protein EPN22_11720 [Nitrospirota bacterium]
MAENVMDSVYFFVDETGTDKKSKIIAFSLVILNNPDNIRTSIAHLKEDILHDPRLKTIPSIQTLADKGFHYQEDSREIRSEFIKMIAKLPFDAYVCFINKDDIKGCEIDYKSLHGKLLGRLLFDRLRDYKSQKMYITIEESSLKSTEIKGIINNSINNICRDRIKIAIAPQIFISSKTDNCLAIADYICGVFKDYYPQLSTKGSFMTRNYDDLRSKIRVVHDFVNDVFYTRHKPLP